MSYPMRRYGDFMLVNLIDATGSGYRKYYPYRGNYRGSGRFSDGVRKFTRGVGRAARRGYSIFKNAAHGVNGAMALLNLAARGSARTTPMQYFQMATAGIVALEWLIRLCRHMLGTNPEPNERRRIEATLADVVRERDDLQAIVAQLREELWQLSNRVDAVTGERDSAIEWATNIRDENDRLLGRNNLLEANFLRVLNSNNNMYQHLRNLGYTGPATAETLPVPIAAESAPPPIPPLPSPVEDNRPLPSPVFAAEKSMSSSSEPLPPPVSPFVDPQDIITINGLDGDDDDDMRGNGYSNVYSMMGQPYTLNGSGFITNLFKKVKNGIKPIINAAKPIVKQII